MPNPWDNCKLVVNHNTAAFLKHAIDTGEYKRVDYKKKPVRYCGMDIKSSVV